MNGVRSGRWVRREVARAGQGLHGGPKLFPEGFTGNGLQRGHTATELVKQVAARSPRAAACLAAEMAVVRKLKGYLAHAIAAHWILPRASQEARNPVVNLVDVRKRVLRPKRRVMRIRNVQTRRCSTVRRSQERRRRRGSVRIIRLSVHAPLRGRSC